MMFLGRLQDNIDKLGPKKFVVGGMLSMRIETPSLKVKKSEIKLGVQSIRI